MSSALSLDKFDALMDSPINVVDGLAVLNPYTANKETQDWLVNGFRLQLRRSPDQVLDIVHCDPNPGASVKVSAYTGGANQHWNVEHTYVLHDNDS